MQKKFLKNTIFTQRSSLTVLFTYPQKKTKLPQRFSEFHGFVSLIYRALSKPARFNCRVAKLAASREDHTVRVEKNSTSPARRLSFVGWRVSPIIFGDKTHFVATKDKRQSPPPSPPAVPAPCIDNMDGTGLLIVYSSGYSCVEFSVQLELKNIPWYLWLSPEVLHLLVFREAKPSDAQFFSTERRNNHYQPRHFSSSAVVVLFIFDSDLFLMFPLGRNYRTVRKVAYETRQCALSSSIRSELGPRKRSARLDLPPDQPLSEILLLKASTD